MANGRAADLSILPDLILSFRERLAELAEEERIVIRVLAALQGDPATCRPATLSAEAVHEAVRVDPGVRATMLALQFGATDKAIVTQLGHLEQAGLVERSGLGWAVVITVGDSGRRASR